MRVLETRVYRGPNPYGYRPVIRLTVDLEELEDHPSGELPNFNEQLVALMPTLQEHGCSYGKPGGFIKRLYDENDEGRKGTWLGHVAEHVALEIQCLAGTPVTYGKTRSVPGQPGVYYVIYSFTEEQVGIEAGELALTLVRSLLPPELPSALPAEERAQFDFLRDLESLIERAQDIALGPDHRVDRERGAAARHPGHPARRPQPGAAGLGQIPAAHPRLGDQQDQQYRRRDRQRQRADDQAAGRCGHPGAAPCAGEERRRGRGRRRAAGLPAGDQAAGREPRARRLDPPDQRRRGSQGLRDRQRVRALGAGRDLPGGARLPRAGDRRQGGGGGRARAGAYRRRRAALDRAS